MNIVVGDIVEWLGSKYTVISINKKGVILKQNFSIGTVLNKPVPIEVVKVIK